MDRSDEAIFAADVGMNHIDEIKIAHAIVGKRERRLLARQLHQRRVCTLHNLDAHIRRRLRALLLQQRKRFIVRRLIGMGARATKAWQTLYGRRKSLWALSHCSPVDRALDKAYFAARGLFSLEHRYPRTTPSYRSSADGVAAGIAAGRDAESDEVA